MLQTKLFFTGHKNINSAAQILRNGGILAIPTETVYGLAADATNDHAVAKIYEAKGRPSFNPLIVHVTGPEMAKDFVEWSDQCDEIAGHFWPGPLTLVLPARKNSKISALVRAGLDSIAIRMPAHPAAQHILAATGRPLAAPSANPSGQISPTCVQHVLNGLSGKIDGIIDGGNCDVGIESTILGMLGTPEILRPGIITSNQITQILGQAPNLPQKSDKITAPGQLTSHYAPQSMMRLNAKSWKEGEKTLGFGPVSSDLNLSPSSNLLEAASNLFSHLHKLDAMQGRTIAVSSIPNDGLGIAINDRLSRAAAPR